MLCGVYSACNIRESLVTLADIKEGRSAVQAVVFLLRLASDGLGQCVFSVEVCAC